MARCTRCGAHYQTITPTEYYCLCPLCRCEVTRSKSNGDVIRSMSNEMLARLFSGMCEAIGSCSDGRCPLFECCPQTHYNMDWDEWMEFPNSNGKVGR